MILSLADFYFYFFLKHLHLARYIRKGLSVREKAVWLTGCLVLNNYSFKKTAVEGEGEEEEEEDDELRRSADSDSDSDSESE